MNNVVNALSYIDDDLVFAALQTASNFNLSNSSARNKERLTPKHLPRIQGGVKVKVMAVSASALIVCIAFAIWAIIALTGNQAIDMYRLDKEEKILDSFTEIQEFYPDTVTANKLSGLNFNEMQIALYYDNDTDWRDSENWYSLIFNGNGEAINVDSVIENYTIYCLFTGTLKDWSVDSVYQENTRDIEINGTTIQLSYSNKIECSYAIFENKGVIYDVRVQFGSTTESDLLSILEYLLN